MISALNLSLYSLGMRLLEESCGQMPRLMDSVKKKLRSSGKILEYYSVMQDREYKKQQDQDRLLSSSFTMSMVPTLVPRNGSLNN